MPFIVIRKQSDKSKLYIRRDPDGEVLWDARRRVATLFSETEADAVAAEINRYTPDIAEVVGAGAPA